MARPITIDVNDLIKKFELFIAEREDPFIQRFCADYGINKDSFYRLAKNNEQLSDLQKRALDKQEAFIVEQAQIGKYNPVFSIFRLKQPSYGWTDKQEVQHTGEVELVALTAGQQEERLQKLLSNMSSERLEELLHKRLAEPVEVVDITPEGKESPTQ